MARLSHSLPCPACGEMMKVSKISKSSISQKVCCPHCRQNVTLEPVAEVEVDWTLPIASSQLEEILISCKKKRSQLESTQQEIEALEAQARSLARWFQTQEPSLDVPHATRAMVDLQARLFEQVLTLKKGHIAIRDCDSGNEKSLAHYIRLTFEAYGWTVAFDQGLQTTHCGEEVTFIVAPGPVSYPVAAVYMALQSSGIRLHSRIDLEQSEEHALIYVHRVSKIPKLLPSPKLDVSEKPFEHLRKTA